MLRPLLPCSSYVMPLPSQSKARSGPRLRRRYSGFCSWPLGLHAPSERRPFLPSHFVFTLVIVSLVSSQISAQRVREISLIYLGCHHVARYAPCSRPITCVIQSLRHGTQAAHAPAVCSSRGRCVSCLPDPVRVSTSTYFYLTQRSHSASLLITAMGAERIG